MCLGDPCFKAVEPDFQSSPPSPVIRPSPRRGQSRPPMTLTFGARSKSSILRLQPQAAGPLAESTEQELQMSHHSTNNRHHAGHVPHPHRAAALLSMRYSLSCIQQHRLPAHAPLAAQCSKRSSSTHKLRSPMRKLLSKLLHPLSSSRVNKPKAGAACQSTWMSTSRKLKQNNNSCSVTRQLYTPACYSLLAASSQAWSSVHATATVTAASLAVAAMSATIATSTHPTCSPASSSYSLTDTSGSSHPVGEADEGSAASATVTSNGSGTAAANASSAASTQQQQQQRTRRSSSGGTISLQTAMSGGSATAAAAAADEHAGDSLVVGANRPGLQSNEGDRELAVLGKMAPRQERNGNRSKRLCVRWVQIVWRKCL